MNIKLFIDASNLIAGRLASYAAKQVLQGNSVDIVNSEKAVISGSKEFLVSEYRQRLQRGMPKTGPFYYRIEDRFLKRMIRGMIYYKRPRGSLAFKRVKCHIGIPDSLKSQKFQTLPEASLRNLKNPRYLTIKEICQIMGKKE